MARAAMRAALRGRPEPRGRTRDEPRAPTPAEAAAARRQMARHARERFSTARRAEMGFARNLRAMARHVGAIVRGFASTGGVIENEPAVRHALERYSTALQPWAQSVGAKMLAEVDKRNAQAWTIAARTIGREVRRDINSTPTGALMRARLAEQVTLITSLPLEAARRVQRLTIEAASGGQRAGEIAKEILRTGPITEARAVLIARTEVGRTAAALTQARAQNIGVETYIWRTAEDSAVRPAHQRLDGHVFRWDTPPVAEADGRRYAPGEGPNCRCYAEPVIAELA